MNILIVCSSSGGHIYPGLALSRFLKRAGERVTFLGIKNQLEEKILKDENLVLFDIPKSFKLALKNPISLLKNRKEHAEFIKKFDVIIGFGGFITFYVSTFKTCKCLYLHEANVDIGDANKYSLKKAKRLFTTFKITDSKKYHEKVTLCGNPVCDDVDNKKNDKKYISFIFGSLGSKTLIDKTIEYLKKQNDKQTYLLVTSEKYYKYAREQLIQKDNIIICPTINKKDLYESSFIMFCRGGASTLAEAIKSQTNTVCIPSPYVKHNHQYRNAEYLYEHHVIQVILEEKYDENSIKEMINYYKSNYYSKMEKENQKSFLKSYPSLEMYLQIKYDKNHQKL